MLTKFKIHLEMERAYPSSGNAQCKFPSFRSSSKEDAMVAGLQSLVRGSLSEGSRRCNVVFKSSLKTHRFPAATKFQYCFLKSCHLCNKRLSQDKDIYMYRGDIGFCSVECRRQQVEMDELMASSSTSRALRSHRHCSVAARRQTRPPIPSNASDHGLLSWD